ncbi:hypothetical protein CDD83_8435 [Cordyceps sp. RAO-2017]|nr:hypothetical protein CDD83_8435 [Cordyceps sp. RAO-2017]
MIVDKDTDYDDNDDEDTDDEGCDNVTSNQTPVDVPSNPADLRSRSDKDLIDTVITIYAKWLTVEGSEWRGAAAAAHNEKHDFPRLKSLRENPTELEKHWHSSLSKAYDKIWDKLSDDTMREWHELIERAIKEKSHNTRPYNNSVAIRAGLRQAACGRKTAWTPQWDMWPSIGLGTCLKISTPITGHYHCLAILASLESSPEKKERTVQRLLGKADHLQAEAGGARELMIEMESEFVQLIVDQVCEGGLTSPSTEHCLVQPEEVCQQLLTNIDIVLDAIPWSPRHLLFRSARPAVNYAYLRPPLTPMTSVSEASNSGRKRDLSAPTPLPKRQKENRLAVVIKVRSGTASVLVADQSKENGNPGHNQSNAFRPARRSTLRPQAGKSGSDDQAASGFPRDQSLTANREDPVPLSQAGGQLYPQPGARTTTGKEAQALSIPAPSVRPTQEALRSFASRDKIERHFTSMEGFWQNRPNQSTRVPMTALRSEMQAEVQTAIDSIKVAISIIGEKSRPPMQPH